MTERERLIKLIDNSPAHFCNGCNEVPEERAEAIEKLADYLIASDVVEVVRCRDCAWWEAHAFGSTIGRCENPSNGLKSEYSEDTDFCSYGRREGNV